MAKVVDLTDEKLFNRFYNEFMVTFFPDEDERSPLEDMLGEFKWNLSHDLVVPESEFHCKEAVAVILDESPGNESSAFHAGIVFDYFPVSNCGLVTHIAVDKSSRGKGFAHKLMDYAITRINKWSKKHGFDEVEEIFAETHKLNVQSSIMDPVSCQKALYKLSFRQVKLPYVQPPLSPDLQPCFNLTLLVLRPDMKPPNYQVESVLPVGFIKSDVLKCFIKEYYSLYFKDPDEYFGSCEWYSKIVNYLDNHQNDKISVKATLPWTDPGDDVSSSNQVLVIGGGVSGLSAAAMLSQAGEDVVLLEAANYLGGRVKQVQPFEGFAPIDMGGELIHGSNTVINKLIEENNWSFEEVYDWSAVDGKNCLEFYYKGKFYSYHSDHPDITRGGRKSHEIVLNHGEKQLEIKKRGESYEDKSAEKLLNEEGFSSDELSIFKALFCQYEASTMDELGAMVLASEEENDDFGEENYRLKDSYAVLVKHLIDQCDKVEKHLDWQVTEVQWLDDNLKADKDWAVSVKNKRGEELRGKAVIITVPLNILKQNVITFKPCLPEDKQQAVNRMQMKGGFKITCRFSQAFWPVDTGAVISVDDIIRQLWVYTLQSTGEGKESCHLVTGFQTADLADEKKGMTEDEIKTKFLQQLDRMFGTASSPLPATDSFMDYLYFNWTDQPHIRGAYSSPTVGAYGSREILSKPEGCLFFAGEHVSRSGGTVHSAMKSGQDAAKHLIEKYLHKD